jgi:predicted nuclease of predicted toxin-antitoxin system
MRPNWLTSASGHCRPRVAALRFKLDENMPASAASFLRAAGHDVDTALEEGMAGATDGQIYAAAFTAERILLTLDIDFADIRTYRPSSGRGIWVLRTGSHALKVIIAVLAKALGAAEVEVTAGRLWIVEPDRIRIRS